MTKDPRGPIGERFSTVYIERGSPVQDSVRFRRRLAAHFSAFELMPNQLAESLKQELGVVVPYHGHYDMDEFFEEGELRDVLDAVTVVYQAFGRSQALAQNWLNRVRNVLAEENMGVVRDDGVVQYFVDEEFERARSATIAALGASRLAAVRAEFEIAHRRLQENPTDTKGCVRSAFEAAEILVKLIAGDGKISVLGAAEVERVLRPLLAAAHVDDQVAREAANTMLSSFKNWVIGAQPYRHGQYVEKYTAPPLSLAIAFLSSAATYIRWLLEVEAAAKS